MDNTTVRIAAGLRLGAPIVQTHVCVCGKSVTVDGHHGLSCRFGSGRHSRHNQVNDVICHVHKGKLDIVDVQKLMKKCLLANETLAAVFGDIVPYLLVTDSQ